MGLHHSGVAACLLLAIGLAVVMLKNDWQREKVVGAMFSDKLLFVCQEAGGAV